MGMLVCVVVSLCVSGCEHMGQDALSSVSVQQDEVQPFLRRGQGKRGQWTGIFFPLLLVWKVLSLGEGSTPDCTWNHSLWNSLHPVTYLD